MDDGTLALRPERAPPRGQPHHRAGLRGGTVTFTPGRELLISLRRVRWVSDARIGGTARWDQSSGWATARLTVRPQAGPVVRLTARWRPFGAQRQRAVIHGSVGKRRLAATAPAP